MTTVIGALRVTLGLDASGLTAGLAQAQQSLKGLGAKMQDIGADLSLKVTAPLLGIGAVALRTAGTFEASMNRVEAATGASADELKAMSDLARELGKSTTFSAGEAADAVEMLAKNGLGASQILGGALEASLHLAAAGGAELASAADLTTDVLANFKKDVGDLGGVVDGVAGVLLASKFGFDDYRLALAQAGGVAGGLGVTFEDFNAVIAATSPAFASGSDAGTSFKTFLQRLVPASNDAADAMEALGLEFFDAAGGMKSMPAIAQELQDALSGLSDEAKTQALSTIFGTDAMRTAIGLMDAGAAGVERLDAAIRSASAAEQAEARTKGFFGALEQLKGALDELWIAVGESGLLTWATQFAEGLTGIVDRISEADPQILRLGTVIAGVAAALGPALIGLGLASAAIAAISAPVLLAVGAVGALAAAGAALYANWDGVEQRFPAVAAAVEQFGAAIGALFSGVGAQLGSYVEVVDRLLQGDLRGAFDAFAGMMQGFGQTIAQTLGAALGYSGEEIAAFTGRVDAAMQAFSAQLTAEFAAAAQGVSAFVADVRAGFDGLIAALGAAPGQMAQIGRDMMAGLLSGLREAWEGVKAWFAGLGEAMPQWLRDTLGIHSPSTVFAEIGGHVMEGLRQGLGSEMGTVQEELGVFAESLGQTFAQLLTQGGSFRDSMRGLLGSVLGGLSGKLASGGFGLLGKALKFPGFAGGTDFAPGGLAWVGERGRELVNLPRGSQVIPHAESMEMMRGGGYREQAVRVLVGVDPRDGSLRPYVAGEIDRATPGIQRGAVGAVQTGARKSRKFLGR